MTSQSEQILEQNLISQLASNGYEKVTIHDEADLLINIKSQLEKQNNKTYYVRFHLRKETLVKK